MTRKMLDDSPPVKDVSTHVFAGFWIRVAATIFDSLFLMGVSLLIFNPLRRLFGVYGAAFSQIDLLEILFSLLYFILLTWWTGQTLGKIITGIRVIPTGEGRGSLSAGQVILREVIGKFVSSLVFGLGYMWVGWNKKKQGWHDLIANTFVVWEKRV